MKGFFPVLVTATVVTFVAVGTAIFFAITGANQKADRFRESCTAAAGSLYRVSDSTTLCITEDGRVIPIARG